jgi:glycerophosphoryl diester phosphodiesterase
MRKWLIRSVIALTLGTAAVLTGMTLWAEPMPQHRFTEKSGPLVIAHRGGRGLWPENTMYAFEQATKLGVDVLELDVQCSSDSVFVVIHDGLLNRTTDGSGPVREHTLAQIRQLDAGYHWTADRGQTYPYRGKGIGIPTLEETLRAFPDIRLNIELKESAAPHVDRFVRMLQTLHHPDRIMIASFQTESIERLRNRYPEIATAATIRDAIVFLLMNKLRVGFAYMPSAYALQVPPSIWSIPVVTEHYLLDAERKNMDVHVWTINQPEEMKRLIALGVDGVMTDFPDRLLDALGRLPTSREPAAGP